MNGEKLGGLLHLRALRFDRERQLERSQLPELGGSEPTAKRRD
jgi:hypothetical protein